MECCTNQMGQGNMVPMGPGPVIQPRATAGAAGAYPAAMAGTAGNYPAAMAGAAGAYPADMAGAAGQFQMTEPIDQYPIAMAYVPWQRWQQTYQLDQALNRGTIFPELDKPFMMGRCR